MLAPPKIYIFSSKSLQITRNHETHIIYYTFSYGFQYCFSAAAMSKAACFRFFCWASHLFYFGVPFGGAPMARAIR